MSALSTTRSAFLLVTLAAGCAFAAPYSVEECVLGSEEGQGKKQQGALLSAKRQLEICSDSSCPAVVQAACTKWLDEVLLATPSLVVVARVDGVDQAKAQVLLDGQPWLDELTGKPQALDPGEHRITVAVGPLTQEQRLVVNLGEKNRLTVFHLAAAAPVPPPPPVAAVRSLPVMPLVLSGTSVAGVALFAGLGLSGRSRLDHLLASECAGSKTCDPAEAGAIRGVFTAADVALAVGVVGAAAAAWQWQRWAAGPAVSFTPYLAPGTQGGAAVGLSGLW
ncbi:MAG: hypothetical protein ACYC8T_32470 [Myxococcaceae bacterium]